PLFDQPSAQFGFFNKLLAISDVRNPENFAYKLSPGVAGGSWEGHINGSTSFSKEVLLDGATVTTERAGNFSESSVSPEAIQEFKVQTSGMSAEYGRTQAGIFNFVMKSGTNDLHGSGYVGVRREWMNANTFSNKFYGLPRATDRKLDYAAGFGGPVYIPKVYDGRNRTFFYVTYERFKQRLSGIREGVKTAPQPEFFEGDFSRLLGSALPQTDALGRPVLQGAIYDPNTFRMLPDGRYIGEMFPDNKIPPSRFSEVSKKVNSLAVPGYLPTVKDPSGRYQLLQNAPAPVSSITKFDQHSFTLKADQNITDRQKLSGSLSYIARPRTFFDQSGLNTLFDPSDIEFGGPLSSADFQRVRHHLLRFAWDWTIRPTLLNNLSIHYNRMVNPMHNVQHEVDGAKELGIKNMTTRGYPIIDWGDGPIVPLADIGDTTDYYQASMGYGLADTVSASMGRHFLKIGIDLRYNPINSRPTAGGRFNFAARATAIPNEPFSGNQTGYSFASYLLGIVDNAFYSQPLGIGSRRKYVALFINDDFKVSDRLTLNLGLRWDYQPPGWEVYDRMASWDLTKIDPQVGLPGAYAFAGDCQECTGKRYFGAKDYKGFYPRIGFAWRPSNDWTLRGAYGIFTQADVGGLPSTAFAWQGTYDLSADPIYPWKGIFNWDDGFPTDRYIPPVKDVSRGMISTPTYVDPNYGKNPYIQSWNLNIQRRLPKQILLDVGYVGNKSTRLPNSGMTRYNQIPVSALTQYGHTLNNPVTSPEEAAAAGVPYPYPGFAGTVASAIRQFPQVRGNSTFTASQAREGFSTYNSLQVIVNRQFTDGLTVYGNYVWSRTLTNMDSSLMDVYNTKLEKAPASWDIPHVIKAYISYELPFGRGKSLWGSASGLLDKIISGWAVSAILNYSSGAPLSFSGANSPFPGGWNGGQRVNIAPGNMGNPAFDKSKFDFANRLSAANAYLNKALFSQPEPFTLGTAAPRYSQIRGFWGRNEDLGLLKNIRVGEKYRFQLRVEMLNAFNRHTLGNPNTNITSPEFGQITSVSGNRTIQAAARVDF
ncbi:MAG TPA: TonB-dependent receptor, partial [Bryobacteraceae bacterium]|nr:TonB-dependent receptor [Bryobacteraceae bacterium]